MIKSNALKKRLELKLNKAFLDITKEDLLNIKELSLNNSDVANNPTPIFFEDLLCFKNLESLSIYNANISLEEYAYILRLKKLKSLSFYDCKLEDLVNIDTLSNLEDIKFINSYTRNIDNISKLENLKSVTLINHDLDNIDFLNISTLNKLVLCNCTIDNYDTIYKLSNLKYLNIFNTNISDLDFLLDFNELKELVIDEEKNNTNTKIIDYLISNSVIVSDDLFGLVGENYV